MKSYHNYTKPSPKVSGYRHLKLSTASKRDKAIARSVSEGMNAKYKNILGKYSITTDDGSWLVSTIMSTRLQKFDTLNEAIDFAHYCDQAVNA